jgi:hypothetical protein
MIRLSTTRDHPPSFVEYFFADTQPTHEMAADSDLPLGVVAAAALTTRHT